MCIIVVILTLNSAMKKNERSAHECVCTFSSVLCCILSSLLHSQSITSGGQTSELADPTVTACIISCMTQGFVIKVNVRPAGSPG